MERLDYDENVGEETDKSQPQGIFAQPQGIPTGAFAFIPGPMDFEVKAAKPNTESARPPSETVKPLTPEDEEEEIKQLLAEKEELDKKNEQLRLSLERQQKLHQLRQLKEQKLQLHQQLLQQVQVHAQAESATHQSTVAAMGNAIFSSASQAYQQQTGRSTTHTTSSNGAGSI